MKFYFILAITLICQTTLALTEQEKNIELMESSYKPVQPTLSTLEVDPLKINELHKQIVKLTNGDFTRFVYAKDLVQNLTKKEFVSILKILSHDESLWSTYPGISKSLQIYLRKKFLRKAFNLPLKPYSELHWDVIMQKAAIVGTHPIEKDNIKTSITLYPFYVLALDKQFVHETVKWVHNSVEHTAKIDVKVNPLNFSFLSPFYDAALLDQKMSVGVFISQGLSTKNTIFKNFFHQLAMVYKLTYKGMKEVKFRDFLSGKIINSNFDVLLEEAHSAGLTEQVIVEPENQYLHTFTGTVNGINTSFYVLMGDSDSPKIKISNREFATWVDQRQNPLLYINGSCNSLHQSQRLLGTITSNKLIAISTGDTARAFSLRSSNAKLQILDGLLKLKSFAWMENQIDFYNQLLDITKFEVYDFPQMQPVPTPEFLNQFDVEIDNSNTMKSSYLPGDFADAI